MTQFQPWRQRRPEIGIGNRYAVSLIAEKRPMVSRVSWSCALFLCRGNSANDPGEHGRPVVHAAIQSSPIKYATRTRVVAASKIPARVLRRYSEGLARYPTSEAMISPAFKGCFASDGVETPPPNLGLPRSVVLGVKGVECG